MQRLPTFEANIQAPVLKAIEDNRSIEDIAGIILEIEMFACPNCGHITPDHSWIAEPPPCLKEGCPCTDPQFDNFDDATLVAEIGNIIRGVARV